VIAGKVKLKPMGEKTRGIASLQKNGIKSNPLLITLTLKPKTPLCNPQNPENPDSKPSVADKYNFESIY
jgi:hypothetical protein